VMNEIRADQSISLFGPEFQMPKASPDNLQNYENFFRHLRLPMNINVQLKDSNDCSSMFSDTWEGRQDDGKVKLPFSLKECIRFEEQSLNLRGAEKVRFGLLRTPHFFIDDVNVRKGKYSGILESDNYHKSYQSDRRYYANLQTLIEKTNMSPPSSPTSQPSSQLQVQMVGQQQQIQEQRSGMEQLPNSMLENTVVDLVIANLNSVQDDKEQRKVLSELIQIMPKQCFQVFVEHICRNDDDVEYNANQGVNEQTDKTVHDEQNEETIDQEMAQDNSQNTNNTTDTESNTTSKKRKAHQSTDTVTRRETRSNKKSKT